MKNELPLHDASFDGIVTSGKNSTLYFTRPDGRGCAVTLGEVRHLHMNDFHQGNIVILFEITSGEPPNQNIGWERLLGAPHPTSSAEHQAAHADFLQLTRSAVEEGTLTLVEMQPAYGADLLALCQTVDFVEH